MDDAPDRRMGKALHQVTSLADYTPRVLPGRRLRLLVLVVVLAGIILPVAAGLWETGIAAFGLLPAIGADRLSLEPWRKLVALPGFGTSLRLTLWTGFAATAVSVALALCVAAALQTRAQRLGRWLAPFLAAPHAAIAIGLAFAIAPSGWIARLLSPWATGWQTPPDIATVQDPWGIALILGLVIKEFPFLLLVTLAALRQIAVRPQIAAARAMGYGRGVAWLWVIAPQVWPLIRLPVWVVLSFSLSVVDMAMILGPSNPPTLAVAVTRWFADPDAEMILPASAAALLQGIVVVFGVAAMWGAERGLAYTGRIWLRRGGRGATSEPGLRVAVAGALALAVLGALSLAALVIWSLTWRWSFPNALPEAWSLRQWMHPAGGWGQALATTLIIGISTTTLSLALAIGWLQAEDRARLSRARWAEALIYLPLVLPQIAFLYGLNVAFLRAGLMPGLVAVIWAQVLFVFPYVMITLSDPWRALDRRMLAQAAALGAGPWRRLVAVKLPVLLGPVLAAAAVGFGVSVAQYLPTLFLGAGRVATLTTEAVTLASGSDRRIVGTYAVVQAAVPIAAYAAAMLVPAWIFRNRRGLAGVAS